MLGRARAPLPAAARRVSRSVCDLLAGAGPRAPPLATVVYSDRYFRYGLPLRAATPGPPAVPAPHAVPLVGAGARPAPGAGVLVAAGAPTTPRLPRYTPMLRARRDLPRVFSSPERPRAPVECGPACARNLHYRQPARGPASPQTVAVHAEPQERAVRLRRRRSSPSEERTTRPQFALPDEGAGVAGTGAEDGASAGEGAQRESAESASASALYSRVYEACAEGARAKRAAGGEWGANEARPGAAGDKLYEKASPPRRKVLNTELCRNELRARVARASGAGPRRAAVRGVLAVSGAFYALALLAFYFLSLA